MRLRSARQKRCARVAVIGAVPASCSNGIGSGSSSGVVQMWTPDQGRELGHQLGMNSATAIGSSAKEPDDASLVSMASRWSMKSKSIWNGRSP